MLADFCIRFRGAAGLGSTTTTRDTRPFMPRRWRWPMRPAPIGSTFLSMSLVDVTRLTEIRIAEIDRGAVEKIHQACKPPSTMRFSPVT